MDLRKLIGSSGDANGPRTERPRGSLPFRSLKWALAYYWPVAAAIPLAGFPLFSMFGTQADFVAGLVYAALTLIGYAISLHRPELAIGIHQFFLLPYWTWYCQLEQSMPQTLHLGIGGHLLFLVFPTITLVTIWGLRGAGASLPLGILAVTYLWADLDEQAFGIFVLSVAALLGATFRRFVVQVGAMQQRLERMAYYDVLTGLPNRYRLREDASKIMGARGAEISLLYIDLDRFKTVNDSLGHHIGDHLLREVAARIEPLVSSGKTVYRLGGDQFAVILDGADEPAAVALAESIREAIRPPFIVHQKTVHLGSSIGIAFSPRHAAAFDELLSKADLAMYRAKTTGDVEIYIKDQHTKERDKLTLESELRLALERDELALHLQPIVDIATQRIVGAEALVRWPHEHRGVLAAGRFIPLAEESSLVQAVDQWVMRRAVKHARALKGAGWDGWISVNLSARSLDDSTWARRFADACSHYGMHPGAFFIEVTESVAMRRPEMTARRLAELRESGARIALDDFGTGYSSLAYLKHLPVDLLKIDGSFVSGIGRYARDEQLLDLLFALAMQWEIGVVAEGVENAPQREWLRDRGCRLGQGLFFAEPLPIAEFTNRVSSVIKTG